MQIHELLSKRLIKQQATNRSLRPGQIIRGDIVKLYPNNKARIQLGRHTMTAQLQAALTIGRNYFFQVEKAEDVIHLKVIQEQSHLDKNAVIKGILNDLNLPPSKVNIQFVQQLLKEDIPFTIKQLQHAFSLLTGVKNKSEGYAILKQLILQQLPITRDVFYAMHAKMYTNYSDQLTQLLNELEKSQTVRPLTSKLMGEIKQVTDPIYANALINNILQEVKSEQKHLFRMLQMTGSLDPMLGYSTWKKAWDPFTVDRLLTVENQPYQLNERSIMEQLERMYQGREFRMQGAMQIVKQWEKTLQGAVQSGRSLTEHQFQSLHNNIIKHLFPVLSINEQNYVKATIENTPPYLSRLVTTLQLYANPNTYEQMHQVITEFKDSDSVGLIKEQFKIFMEKINQLSSANSPANELKLSFKTMLMQLISHSDSIVREHAHQVIHLMNGLHIDSVHESNHFIQASISLPGEKFSLNQDLQLEFESKKTKDGKIDPDYCRILFLMELQTMKKTIVDMNIQKRFVSVTIYNDYLKASPSSFEGVLKAGMKKLDYQLSSVTVKPLQEAKEDRPQPTVSSHNLYKGVDYRV
ncbi:hypothetical protein ACLIBH_03145 [Virgibacillus sp. W0430]|uniref:hypothetical protein n=1 Tax=Virgibacillus sp. W0430 TaxID=3391580 RepID=UPI003F48AF4D